MMDEEYAHYAQERLHGQFGEMASWLLVQPFLDNKKVLDVGCSDGLYLRHFAASSVGIERIHDLADAAKSRGLEVVCDDIPSALRAQPDASYEAVFLSHVLEHLERPLDVLREANRVLNSDGLVVLGLPTERNVFRTVWRMDYFAGTHLYAFSTRNAGRLLELSGFRQRHVFFHLPRVRGRLGQKIHRLWNSVPLPGKEWLSMGYWIVAQKDAGSS